MEDSLFDLYVCFPTDLHHKVRDKVFNTINYNHPECELQAVIDGYWSGVQEDTYKVQIRSSLSSAQATVEEIRLISGQVFVALDEPEE